METTKNILPKRTRRMAREPQTGNEQDTAGSDVPLARPATKSGVVLDLLMRPDGCSLDALAEATGWQPHTIRAVLTGLRKKGHALTSIKPVSGSRIYRILLVGSEA